MLAPETVIDSAHGSSAHTFTQERIICLNGQVDETVSANIVAQLLFLEADNPEKPISLYINSPGGSVTAGMSRLHFTPAKDHPTVLLQA